MRIAIVCNDTRGGIQPYVALALGLRAAGHDVRAIAPADLAPMFSARGLETAPLSGSIEEIMRGSGGVTEKGMLASIRFAAREMPRRLGQWTREALDACQGVELITGGIGGMVVALSVAEKVGVPFVEAHLQPVGAPSRDYPGVLMPGIPAWLGSAGRRLSHALTQELLWGPFRGAMARARHDVLGLRGRPSSSAGQPVLYAFSRHVVPVPPSARQERHVTGYWSLTAPADSSLPGELEAFLDLGGPVVSIGFGSMATQDPRAVTELVLGAVRDAGVRAVSLSGWGGLERTGAPELFPISSVPHDQLFPRVAAVVHHGGAGTTAAGLRAGVPSVVIPFTMDQPFWASRVAALGVGPAPIPRSRLTRGRLANAIRQAVDDAPMAARAATLGARIRAEDGVAEAIKHLECGFRTIVNSGVGIVNSQIGIVNTWIGIVNRWSGHREQAILPR